MHARMCTGMPRRPLLRALASEGAPTNQFHRTQPAPLSAEAAAVVWGVRTKAAGLAKAAAGCLQHMSVQQGASILHLRYAYDAAACATCLLGY